MYIRKRMPNPNKQRKKVEGASNQSIMTGFRKYITKVVAATLYGIGAAASIHYGGTIYKDNRVDTLLEAKKYKHNKYDEDVRGYVRYRLDKAIDRKESIDVVDELNEAQAHKNETGRVPDPVLRNPERKYESYKREIKDE